MRTKENKIDKRKLTKPHVRVRREQVKNYLAANLSISEIARKLGVSERTIYDDRTVIFQELAKEISEKRADEIAGDFWNRHRLRTRYLWEIATDKRVSTGLRVQALQSLQKEDSAILSILQRMGILEKAPEKIEHTFANLAQLAQEYLNGESDLDIDDVTIN